MPEEKSDGIKSTVGGWIKGIGTSIVGLLSGAVIMYLTPLVNNAIKPPKPVANFASQVSGLSVQFNNRSSGGIHGWWDFGDGSALEPFDPKIDLVKHNYTKPGTYSVRLTLQNLLGEENDRSAPVTLDPEGAPKPEIADFSLKSKTPGDRVPALFRLKASIKGATHCILSLGDDRPIEILDDAANVDRLVTFSEMGSYTLRLSAVNGKQLVEKTETVYISPNDSTDPTAKLLVTYQAVNVQRYAKDMRVHCGWTADVKESVSAFRKERPAEPGCTFVSAELLNKNDKNAQVRNASVTISPDKTKLIVAGELLRPTGVLAPKGTAPAWVAEIKASLERRSPPTTITKGDMAMTVSLGKSVVIPLPTLDPGWEVVKKQVTLELWDGSRKAWEGSQAVTGAKVALKNQTCYVTATPQTDGFAVKIDAPGLPPAAAPVSVLPPPAISAPPVTPSPTPVGPIRKVGFEFNPLLPKKK